MLDIWLLLAHTGKYMHNKRTRSLFGLTIIFYIFQIIKRITDGGADYSFECIGDTGMITTALQSCCDVIL